MVDAGPEPTYEEMMSIPPPWGVKSADPDQMALPADLIYTFF